MRVLFIILLLLIVTVTSKQYNSTSTDQYNSTSTHQSNNTVSNADNSDTCTSTHILYTGETYVNRTVTTPTGVLIRSGRILWAGDPNWEPFPAGMMV